MKCHEEIIVFYQKLPIYNPQWWYSTPYKTGASMRKKVVDVLGKTPAGTKRTATESDGRRYPLSILKFPKDGERIHPTQKPVPLLEYLIKTYTNEGEVVLDNCMGSGSCGVAAVNTSRDFIGIELDEGYFNIAKERIEKAVEDSGYRQLSLV
jgi:site-specific DNA-methyltransferase (adenine-specific)